jgi:hypothetical protein
MPPSPRKPDGKGAGKGRGDKTPPPAPKPAKPVGAKPAGRPRPAFPKKNQIPTVEEFAARLPLPIGKRWDAVRSFLAKQKDLAEDVFFYGPKSGWALRYVLADKLPVCALFVLGDRPLGIVSLTADDAAAVPWAQLSPVAQKARKTAHGSPSLLWVDVPLDGPGATDFRAIMKTKLRRLEAERAASDDGG